MVHDAERADAVPVGERERHAGVEAQPRPRATYGLSANRSSCSASVITNTSSPRMACAHIDSSRWDSLTVDAVMRLEPLAVVVDERDQRDRDVERRARDLRVAVEAGLGLGVEDAEVPQRGQPLGLVGRAAPRLCQRQARRRNHARSFVRRCDCDAGHTSQSVISGRISLAGGASCRDVRDRRALRCSCDDRVGVGREVVERTAGRGFEHDDRRVVRGARARGPRRAMRHVERFEALRRRRFEQRGLDVRGR